MDPEHSHALRTRFCFDFPPFGISRYFNQRVSKMLSIHPRFPVLE
jgi:hypothetical protein